MEKNISKIEIKVELDNNKVPEKRTNFFDFKFDNSFEKNFLDKFNLFSKKIKKIIFIGAASILENDLFMSSEDKIIEKILNTNIENDKSSIVWFNDLQQIINGKGY